jgi:hypothetical protein
MKKTILVALAALSLATAARADGWADYTAAKTDAKAALASLEKGNTETAVLEQALVGFKAAADAASGLNRSDIAAWMLNNRAYASITWFKNAGYRDAMSALEKMPASKEKPAAIAEAKASLAMLFDKISAQAIEDLAAAAEASSDDNLQAVVDSNKGFLAWVTKFISK